MKAKKKKHFTKTSTFIFPLLNIPRTAFLYDKKTFGKVDTSSRFINSYLYNTVCEKHNNHVSIIIDSYRDAEFDNFYIKLSSHDAFVDSYEVDDTLIMVFAIPDDMLDDVTKIIDGKYSTVSNVAKQLIMKHHYFDSQSSVIPMILNKSQALKTEWENRIGCSIGDNEVWVIMNPDEETLTIDKIHAVVKNRVLTPSNEFE
jgi:hypothetical protein